MVQHPSALSAAIVQGLQDGVSNYLTNVNNPRVWSQAFPIPLQTAAVDDEFRLVTSPFPPVWVPEAYDEFIIQVRAREISAIPGAAVALGFLFTDTMWIGTDTIDSSDMGHINEYSLAAFAQVTSHNWDVITDTASVRIRDVSGNVWMILFSYAVDGGIAEISNLDITATTKGNVI
jgi:hypothetical protein